jgi:hypothetical protein
MRVKILSFSFLPALLFSISAHAQITNVKAYMVLPKGDTVWGTARVNTRKEFYDYEKVSFKDSTGRQKSYDADKILAYGYNDHEFVVRELDGENLFFRILTKGPITFYKLMFPGYRMNKLSWETEYYLSTRDHPQLMVLKEHRMKKQLIQLMEDNPEFINPYDEKLGVEADRILEIIKQYNNWKLNSGS